MAGSGRRRHAIAVTRVSAPIAAGKLTGRRSLGARGVARTTTTPRLTIHAPSTLSPIDRPPHTSPRAVKEATALVPTPAWSPGRRGAIPVAAPISCQPMDCHARGGVAVSVSKLASSLQRAAAPAPSSPTGTGQSVHRLPSPVYTSDIRECVLDRSNSSPAQVLCEYRGSAWGRAIFEDLMKDLKRISKVSHARFSQAGRTFHPGRVFRPDENGPGCDPPWPPAVLSPTSALSAEGD